MICPSSHGPPTPVPTTQPGKGPDPISPFSVERRALLFGAAAVAAGALSAPASAAPEAPAGARPLGGAGQIPRNHSKPFRSRLCRARGGPVLPRQHIRGRAPDPADDRSAAHQTGRDPVGLLGDAVRRLEADPLGRRDRLSRRAREPRPRQPAQTHLFRRRHPRPLRAEIPGEGRRLSRQARSIRSTPTSPSCAIISTITGTSTGICISA